MPAAHLTRRRLAATCATLAAILAASMAAATLIGPVRASLWTALGPGGQLEFHPLVGGADPALGWRCLTLFEKQVTPALESAGLVTTRSAP